MRLDIAVPNRGGLTVEIVQGGRQLWSTCVLSNADRSLHFSSEPPRTYSSSSSGWGEKVAPRNVTMCF